MQKTTEGTSRSILMSSADRAPMSMGNSCTIVSNKHTIAFQRSITSAIKLSNPFTNVCWVSVLSTFSALPQILAASTVFFCLIPPKRRNDGDGFGATAAGLF